MGPTGVTAHARAALKRDAHGGQPGLGSCFDQHK